MADPRIISITRTERYSSQMAEELAQMREARIFTDFTITVEEHRLPCHRVMIAAHSPVLKALLLSDMAEAAKLSVKLDHLKLDPIRVIMDYMYLGQVSINGDVLMDTIKACDYLQMHGLKERCIEKVSIVLSPENAIAWLEFARKLEIDEVKEQCMQLMVSNFSEVAQQCNFLRLDFILLQDIFHNVCNSTNDRDAVLGAAMKWIDHDKEQRLEQVETLLDEVQLDRCSPQAILDVLVTFRGIVLASETVYNSLTQALKDITTKEVEHMAAKQDGETGATSQSSSKHNESEEMKLSAEESNGHLKKDRTGNLMTPEETNSQSSADNQEDNKVAAAAKTGITEQDVTNSKQHSQQDMGNTTGTLAKEMTEIADVEEESAIDHTTMKDSTEGSTSTNVVQKKSSKDSEDSTVSGKTSEILEETFKSESMVQTSNSADVGQSTFPEAVSDAESEEGLKESGTSEQISQSSTGEDVEAVRPAEVTDDMEKTESAVAEEQPPEAVVSNLSTEPLPEAAAQTPPPPPPAKKKRKSRKLTRRLERAIKKL